MVREHSALSYVHFVGQEVPFNIPLVEGMAHFHGFSKVWVNLEGPVLFQ